MTVPGRKTPGAFFLLQAGKMAGDGPTYQWLNLVGAAAVLVTLLGKFNLAVFVLESAWVLVSAYGVVAREEGRQVDATLTQVQMRLPHAAAPSDRRIAGNVVSLPPVMKARSDDASDLSTPRGEPTRRCRARDD